MAHKWISTLINGERYKESWTKKMPTPIGTIYFTILKNNKALYEYYAYYVPKNLDFEITLVTTTNSKYNNFLDAQRAVLNETRLALFEQADKYMKTCGKIDLYMKDL